MIISCWFHMWRKFRSNFDLLNFPFCFLSLTQNVMILGDLNAGCSYVTIKGWRAVRLRSDPNFHWLIGDKQDTTVREKTHCAYDRSVTTEMNKWFTVLTIINKRGFLLQTLYSTIWFLLLNRIIVHGREINSCIVPGSAQPFNFKETFHLTEEEVNYILFFTSLVYLQWTLILYFWWHFRLLRWVITFL